MSRLSLPSHERVCRQLGIINPSSRRHELCCHGIPYCNTSIENNAHLISEIVTELAFGEDEDEDILDDLADYLLCNNHKYQIEFLLRSWDARLSNSPFPNVHHPHGAHHENAKSDKIFKEEMSCGHHLNHHEVPPSGQHVDWPSIASKQSEYADIEATTLRTQVMAEEVQALVENTHKQQDTAIQDTSMTLVVERQSEFLTPKAVLQTQGFGTTAIMSTSSTISPGLPQAAEAETSTSTVAEQAEIITISDYEQTSEVRDDTPADQEPVFTTQNNDERTIPETPLSSTDALHATKPLVSSCEEDVTALVMPLLLAQATVPTDTISPQAISIEQCDISESSSSTATPWGFCVAPAVDLHPRFVRMFIIVAFISVFVQTS